jgi:hypothetical protein
VVSNDLTTFASRGGKEELRAEITALALASILLFSLAGAQLGFAQVQMKDTTESTDKAISQNVSILVPLYIAPGNGASYPSTEWNSLKTLAHNHPKVSIYAIINPASGPGYAQNMPNPTWTQDYTSGISDLNAEGIVVLGYVPTNYAQRPVNDVYSDIDHYSSWYGGSGLKGIFFDEMNYTDVAKVQYYKDATNYAKSKGFIITIGNPGTDTRKEFIGSVDKIMIAEGAGMPTQSELKGSSNWHLNYDKKNFGYYAYDVPTWNSTIENAAIDAAKYTSTFYITDDYYRNPNTDNPWDTLSSHMSSMVSMLENMVPSGDDKLRSGIFEHVTGSSTLVNDPIDTIKMKLRKTGSPPGYYIVGVFNGTDGSIKKIFANSTANSLSTTSTEMTFDNSSNQMSVTSDNASWGMYSGGTTIWAEYASATSSLVGKKIDTIKIALQREGSPTGSVTFGVWDSSGNLKQQFGTVTAMAISTTKTDITARGNEYTIASGDRIGVSYSGGNSLNLVRGYDDTSNPFDGTNSYRQRWDSSTSSWVTTATGNDIHATLMDHPGLPYTLAADDYIGIYYNKGNATNYVSAKIDTDSSNPFDSSNSTYAEMMHTITTNSTRDVTMTLTKTGNLYEDTTASFSTALNDVNKATAERITSTATNLIGEKINEITVRLKKTGSPTGTVYIGVLDSSNNIVQQFGTIDASTVSTTATDYTFTLAGPTTYTIAADNRIGVKYTSGTSSNYIEVFRDQDGNPEPFGTDAYREYYTTFWQVFNGNDYNQDLYMVMRLAGQ